MERKKRSGVERGGGKSGQRGLAKMTMSQGRRADRCRGRRPASARESSGEEAAASTSWTPAQSHAILFQTW